MRRFAQGITERRQKWKEEKEREEREEKERKEKEKNIDYDKVYKLYLKAVSSAISSSTVYSPSFYTQGMEDIHSLISIRYDCFLDCHDS